MLTFRVLLIGAGNIAAESNFSVESNTVTPTRCSLGGNSIDVILTLQSFGKAGISLPSISYLKKEYGD